MRYIKRVHATNQCFHSRYFTTQNYFCQPSIPENQAERGGSAPLETECSRAKVQEAKGGIDLSRKNVIPKIKITLLDDSLVQVHSVLNSFLIEMGVENFKFQKSCSNFINVVLYFYMILFYIKRQTTNNSEKRVRNKIYFLLQFPPATQPLENTCAIAFESSSPTLTMEPQYRNCRFEVFAINFEHYQQNFQYFLILD